MARKTYQLGADADGQPVTRVVFTKADGTDVELTGDYTTENVEEQLFLDGYPFVESGKAKAGS